MRWLVAVVVFPAIVDLCRIECRAMADQGGGKGRPILPAVIVFGDSILDTGNNNGIKTILKCNFPPYGINLTGHKPTGRFCNGKIPADFIASKLGIKEYLPAYVGTKLSPEDLMTGVSFASGGAGYDPLTSRMASVISLDQQLELFGEYKEKVRAVAGEERAFHIFNNSLYVVCVGSDDVSNLYFPTLLRKMVYDIPSYTNLLRGYASVFVQKLIQSGAKKIVVIGIPPIGCVPSQRTLEGGLLRACAVPQNQMAVLFNQALDIELQILKTKYPGALLVFADIYGILYDIIQRPYDYGFEVSTKGCCGTGKLEVSFSCNSLTTSVCDNVSKYVFWDSFHPTENTYKVLVDHLYKKYINLLL